MGTTGDLVDQLCEDLRVVVAEATADAGVTLVNLRRLSGGASRETWSFDCLHDDGSVEPLILRRDPPGAPKTGMKLESEVLRAAAGVGVPVPRLIASSDDTSVLGSPFIVMERVEGETIPRRILRDEAYRTTRPLLAGQCGSILARVHAIPVAGVGGLAEADPVEEWRSTLDNFAEPHPAFELGLRWLDANRPSPRASTVVHGDFRNGNLIVGPEGVRSVLDWELAHLGDPLEDLGWLCVRAWRFGVDRPVGGFGEYSELIEAYENASASVVDRDALRWWEAMGTLKWGVMCIIQRWTHTAGFVRSVELAAIGRRVCENEWDLLNLLPTPWGGK